jgi:hypothetical protein
LSCVSACHLIVPVGLYVGRSMQNHRTSVGLTRQNESSSMKENAAVQRCNWEIRVQSKGFALILLGKTARVTTEGVVCGALCRNHAGRTGCQPRPAPRLTVHLLPSREQHFPVVVGMNCPGNGPFWRTQGRDERSIMIRSSVRYNDLDALTCTHITAPDMHAGTSLHRPIHPCNEVNRAH